MPADSLADVSDQHLIPAARRWACDGGAPGGPPFRRYAGVCARRRAITAIDAARTIRRRTLNFAESLDAPAEAGQEPLGARDGASRLADPFAITVAHARLTAMREALPTLTAKEAECLSGVLNGRPYPEMAAASAVPTRPSRPR